MDPRVPLAFLLSLTASTQGCMSDDDDDAVASGYGPCPNCKPRLAEELECAEAEEEYFACLAAVDCNGLCDDAEVCLAERDELHGNCDVDDPVITPPTREPEPRPISRAAR